MATFDNLDNFSKLCDEVRSCSTKIELTLRQMERAEKPKDYIFVIRHRLKEMEQILINIEKE